MSEPMYGRIMNYRTGLRTQYSRECLIKFSNVNSAVQVGALIGQKVVWKDEKKRLIGKIIGFHGNSGVVRVKFKKGVPGPALGTTVELIR